MCDVEGGWLRRFCDFGAGRLAGPMVLLAHELFDALPVHQLKARPLF